MVKNDPSKPTDTFSQNAAGAGERRPAGGRVRRVLLEWIEPNGPHVPDPSTPLIEALQRHAPALQVRELDSATEMPWTELRFLALDTETTGLNRAADRIMEIAWVLFERGVVKERFSQLLQVGIPLPQPIIALTGIEDSMLAQQPEFSSIADSLVQALESVDFVVAYHAPFDRGFIEHELARCGKTLPVTPWVDPLVFIKEVDRYKPGKKLADASERWGVAHGKPHRAWDDALATGELLLKVGPFLPMRTLDDVLCQQDNFRKRQRSDADPMRKPEQPRGRSPISSSPPGRGKAPNQIRQNTKDFLFGPRSD